MVNFVSKIKKVLLLCKKDGFSYKNTINICFV
jgi:hypothetical protein